MDVFPTMSLMKTALTLQLDEDLCRALDSAPQIKVQNKMAGICEEMCKELDAYPKNTQCPKFIAPEYSCAAMANDEVNVKALNCPLMDLMNCPLMGDKPLLITVSNRTAEHVRTCILAVGWRGTPPFT